MATVSVLNMEGKEVGTMELNDAIFGVKVNEHLVHMAVVQHLANKRQGTQSARTRSEVRGGGRKPWRQKGTGHARQGSIRAPQWKGGGVVFAPKPRDYSMRLNKKEKDCSFEIGFDIKGFGRKIYVLDELAFDEVKTKKMAAVLKGLEINKALIVTDNMDENVLMSARNIPNVKAGHIMKIMEKNKKTEEEKEAISSTLNVYDILKYNNLVITKSAVELIEEVYA